MNAEASPLDPVTAVPLRTKWAGRIRWFGRPEHETGVVTAFFLLLTLAVFLPALLGPDDQIIGKDTEDLPRQFIHWRSFGFGQMAAGHFPLWNPHIYGGTQYFGGFQSALLYPPNWLYLWLPLTRAINVGIALHVFLAGWFMYFWVRHRGLHVVASVLAGVLFMFGGTYFPHIFAGHLPNLCTMVWGPLILLAIDGWFARRTVGWLLLGGGALAMQIFAGHPQYVFYTGVACAIYAATKLCFAPQRWRAAAGLALIPLAGAALSAVQVFEGLHAGSESLRSRGPSIGFAGSFSFPPENLLTLIVPGFFGNEVASPYWGRHSLWEMCPFIGITGVALAVFALVRVRGRETWICAGIACVLVVIALGRYTPLFEPLYYHAPGFGKFRGWSKFIYPAMLFTVMLAAIGCDRLLRHGGNLRALGAMTLGAALLLGGTAFWAGWSAHQGSADSPQPWSGWLTATFYSGESMNTSPEYWNADYAQAAAKFAARGLWTAAGTCLALAVTFFAGGRWRAALFAVPGIALCEILLFAVPVLVTCEYALFRRDAVSQFLETHPLGDGRIFDRADPNNGMTTGEKDLWGYDPGVSRRYAEFVAVAQNFTPDSATQDLRFQRLPDIYGTMLRCRYAFGFLQKETNQILFRIYEPALVSPHVMLVPQVRVVPKGDAVLRAMATPFDPRATVILESAPEPPPAEHPAPGKAAVTAETTDTLTIDADLPDPAVLVVTDSYSDGWRARSLLNPGNGSPQTGYNVMPADHCLRAIPLAAGHHRILLEYRPTAFLVGAWVSAISTLVYAAALVWVVRFRRRGQTAT